MSRMKSAVLKRSVVIAGHKTSVSLEDKFWYSLKSITRKLKLTLSELATKAIVALGMLLCLAHQRTASVIGFVGIGRIQRTHGFVITATIALIGMLGALHSIGPATASEHEATTFLGSRSIVSSTVSSFTARRLTDGLLRTPLIEYCKADWRVTTLLADWRVTTLLADWRVTTA